ncbi:hypothetical protein SAMN05421769_0640 [Chryseobacterium scophthalmum]|uniref:Uncharacterized protein n=1 Tax=Chryseobacterium scophthalmum TaxID=59733 RepID=A0A1N6ES52_9FLAO|nr:hypothetical protein SAMN05421769_0640 [Chryseobacterium scophthalmum]
MIEFISHEYTNIYIFFDNIRVFVAKKLGYNPNIKFVACNSYLFRSKSISSTSSNFTFLVFSKIKK